MKLKPPPTYNAGIWGSRSSSNSGSSRWRKPFPAGGGSVRGKAPNKDRSRNAGALLLYSNYFADNAINTPKEFHRCFRMNKELFMKIVQGVREYDDYFAVVF
jgi:hypothetical protein